MCGSSVYCITLQHTATHCNTLQHTAAHCSTLRHTATYFSASLLMPTSLFCDIKSDPQKRPTDEVSCEGLFCSPLLCILFDVYWFLLICVAFHLECRWSRYQKDWYTSKVTHKRDLQKRLIKETSSLGLFCRTFLWGISLDCRWHRWRSCMCDMTHCKTLQHAPTRCNTLQHTATRCNALRHAATRCNTLQHAATRCNTLQHAATRCNTL